MDLFLTLGACALAVVFIALWARERKMGREKSSDFSKKLSWQKESNRTRENALLNTLTDAFLIVNQEGKILFANDSTTEFVAGRLVKGRHIKEVFLDEGVAAVMTKSLATERNISERILLTPQISSGGLTELRGRSAWLIDAAPLERSSAKKVIRVVIRDVTTQHQTEQVRKDFVANASHELRTPLSIINGYLENLIEDEIENPEFTARSLTIMKKHSDRITRLVEDMLVISRLESGESISLNIAPFPFSECIQDIVERLEPLISQQGADIKMKFEDPGLILLGDRFYWTQIFFNLIENALKQNSTQALKIEIGATQTTEREIKLWVADNGVGIPSSDLPFIFRRFYRVEKHHNQDNVKGTGLGLSIVRRGVEAHDGEIEATSTPGQRTTFTITLPAAAKAGPSQR